jgi:hypothetical protein
MSAILGSFSPHRRISFISGCRPPWVNRYLRDIGLVIKRRPDYVKIRREDPPFFWESWSKYHQLRHTQAEITSKLLTAVCLIFVKGGCFIFCRIFFKPVNQMARRWAKKKSLIIYKGSTQVNKGDPPLFFGGLLCGPSSKVATTRDITSSLVVVFFPS